MKDDEIIRIPHVFSSDHIPRPFSLTQANPIYVFSSIDWYPYYYDFMYSYKNCRILPIMMKFLENIEILRRLTLVKLILIHNKN